MRRLKKTDEITARHIEELRNIRKAKLHKEAEVPEEVERKVKNFNDYLDECRRSLNSYLQEFQDTVNNAAEFYFSEK